MFWKELQHNGPFFIHNIFQSSSYMTIKYLDRTIETTLEEQEFLYYFYRHIDKDHFDSTFQENFWKSWSELMEGRQDLKIEYDKIDLVQIKQFFEKVEIKKNKREVPDSYKFCKIDKQQIKVFNYVVDPQGIFIGRGEHPLRGTIKRKITPEDVIINISKMRTIPRPNVKGKWKNVISDNTLFWISSWKHPITHKIIYMYPAFESEIRMLKIKDKFDKARSLKKYIPKIKISYNKLIDDDDVKNNQIGIVIYLIDTLWLRVGSSKDKINNTYGITSVLKKHIFFYNNYSIRLCFPGKDSIVYDNTFKVPEKIYNKLQDYTKDNSCPYLFKYINYKTVNNYLNEIFPFLTAKVLRTYNASLFFSRCLDNRKKSYDLTKDTEAKNLIVFCLTIVAQKCNHKKGKQTSSSHQDKIKKLKIKIKKEKNINKLNIYKHKLETMEIGDNFNITTSLKNYIDPRILFSFCKYNSIELKKIITPNIYKQMIWANNISKSWIY